MPVRSCPAASGRLVRSTLTHPRVGSALITCALAASAFVGSSFRSLYAAVGTPAAHAAHAAQPPAGVRVQRDSAPPVMLTTELLRTLPRASATLPPHGAAHGAPNGPATGLPNGAPAGTHGGTHGRTHGRTHGAAPAGPTYTGVPLALVLARGGAWPAGDASAGTAGARGNLRGAALARYVVVTGADGYRVVLALAELDTATVRAAGGPVLLADSVDGRPIPAAEGPWRLVVPGDRRPARAVRQVVGLAVRGAAP